MREAEERWEVQQMLRYIAGVTLLSAKTHGSEGLV